METTKETLVETPPNSQETTRFSLRDLVRGLFPLRTKDADAGCDYAREIEERYSKPRRCC